MLKLRRSIIWWKTRDHLESDVTEQQQQKAGARLANQQQVMSMSGRVSQTANICPSETNIAEEFLKKVRFEYPTVCSV